MTRFMSESTKDENFDHPLIDVGLAALTVVAT
jgi:hypothetical protein